MLRLSRVSQSLLTKNLQKKGGELVNKLYVGIDVSSDNNVAYIMKPNGDMLSEFPVENNLGGYRILAKRIVAADEALDLSIIEIGMEATSVYGEHLVHAFREDGSLGRFERKIHVLNPKQVSKFKESYNDLPKNDWIDAFVIADCLRFGRIRNEVYIDDYRYEALKTLTRARFYAVQNLAREKQRFGNLLFKKCCCLAQNNEIKNTAASTFALMENFESVDDLANASLEELSSFLNTASRGRFADSDETAKVIQAAARGSFRLPKTINDSVNQAMSVSIASIRAIEKQIKDLEKAIEKQFEIIPNTIISVPGIGKVYSAGIIAEIGNPARFETHAAVAKYAGLVWSQHQSNKFEAEDTHLIKSGNRFLRYYLLEAANSVRRCDSEFRRYYDLKFKEVTKHQHKRALALTARKLVRLLFRLLKENRLYIPA